MAKGKNGLSNVCKQCVHDAYRVKHPRPESKLHKRVTETCGCCEKEFVLPLAEHDRRLKQMAAHSGKTKLYCSRACSALESSKDRPGNIAQFKRRPGWSDERWYWERLLVQLGLGEMRGISSYLDYGVQELHNYTAEGFDRFRRSGKISEF